MEATRQGLEILSTALDIAPIPEPFKSAVTAIPDLALQILNIVEAVKGNVEDAEALGIYIADVTSTTMDPFRTFKTEPPDSPRGAEKRVDEFTKVLVGIKEEMKILMDRRLGKRIFTYSRDASKLAEMKKRVDDAISQLQAHFLRYDAQRLGFLQLETAIVTGHDVERMGQEHRLMLQKLEASLEAHRALLQQLQKQEIESLILLLGKGDLGASEKDPCLEDTRVALLDSIMRWTLDSSSESKHCFCLLGMAGSGKSAIAATIADRLKASRHLGARFHFARNKERNNGVILALARQLASWGDERLQPEIASAIKDEREIAQMRPETQFRKLIQEPLESLESTSPPLVIVLDALDECDPKYVSTLLQLIRNGLAKLPVCVKFFITSRAKPQLLYHFDSEPMKSRRTVHTLTDEDAQVVDGDIGTYFKEKLPEVVGPLLKDPSDWPGEERRRALVLKAQRLFLWATTATRIIADPNMGRDPEKKLARLLSSEHQGHLDAIYGQILGDACPAVIDNDTPDTISLFRNVLGTLVVARAPINICTIASFLDPNESHHKGLSENIRFNVLRYLQAVLIIPGVDIAEPAEDAEPIRFIHTSFIDYLSDTSRCDSRYAINVAEHHERMTIGCFRQMLQLKQNMCNLDPSLLNSEVGDLEQRIQDHIPRGLQYACIHMPAHVSSVPTDNSVVAGLIDDFSKTRLMFWLEGLSLMGRARESVAMATVIESWLEAKPPRITPLPSRPPAPAPAGFLWG
ncbi:hypothetical protein FRB98_008879, partial [Tulasnella sp. 332]